MLRHWLKYFDPGQFILISSEDFFADPQQVLLQIKECKLSAVTAWQIVSDVAFELGVPFAHDQVR